MSRAWKPGDLVMVPFEAGHRMLLVTEYGGVFSDGYGVEEKTVREFSDVRPLVVIDPEDTDQIARLVRSLIEVTRDPGVKAYLPDLPYADVKAALREFADPKPPKPDEPTGLGAVVETQPMIVNEDGDTANVLIRHADGLWWINGEGGWYWADVPAVKVLSEGVTA